MGGGGQWFYEVVLESSRTVYAITVQFDGYARDAEVITPKPAELVCQLASYCVHVFSLCTQFCGLVLGPL